VFLADLLQGCFKDLTRGRFRELLVDGDQRDDREVFRTPGFARGRL